MPNKQNTPFKYTQHPTGKYLNCYVKTKAKVQVKYLKDMQPSTLMPIKPHNEQTWKLILKVFTGIFFTFSNSSKKKKFLHACNIQNSRNLSKSLYSVAWFSNHLCMYMKILICKVLILNGVVVKPNLNYLLLLTIAISNWILGQKRLRFLKTVAS